MASEEIEISQLESAEELIPDMVIPVETAIATKATTLQKIKEWLSSFFVGKTGDENIEGNKNFIGSIKVPTVGTSSNDGNSANTQWVNNKIITYQPQITNLSPTTDNNLVVQVNKIYSTTVSVGVKFILPTPTNKTIFNQIKVMMKVTGTPTINWGTTNFFNKSEPSIEAGNYDVYFDYDNLLNAWVCGVLPKGTSA